MKNIKKLIVATSLFIGSLAFAQAPEKMSYQAVVRNTTNNLVINQPVGMQISILQGSATGTAVYVETQTPTSNANGLVTLEIGGGLVVSGNMATINWANGPYFIKTETDPTGGSSYTITGTSQLLSAPYALYAKTSGSSTPGPAGPQGIQGPAGPAGANGLDGATGPMGPQGPQGLTGPQGPAGANGLDGATGPMGPQGPAGANGLDGATGPMGPQGPAGANGLDGATGPMGPQGPAGANGLDGATGPMGPQGPIGLTGAAGPQGPQGLTGPQGPAGVPGANGQGVPTGGTTGQVLAKVNGTDYNTQWVTPANTGWGLTGNAGTTFSNFIGTTDNMELQFRTNNIARWRITQNGRLTNSSSLGGNSIFIGGGNETTSGNNNTQIGASSMALNTTGDNNSAFGESSLQQNTSGIRNTAIGASSLLANVNGNANVAVGFSSLQSNTSGSTNTAVGQNALLTNTTGSNNTALGFQASVSANNLSNATVIGANATVDASNKIRLGNNSVTATDIAGQVKVNAQSTTDNFTLPATRGTANQVLSTDGAGATQWVTPSAGGSAYPNVEVSVTNTTIQNIPDLTGGTSTTVLNFSGSNNPNASLTGGNTWNGSIFTVGSTGAGWYQINSQVRGVSPTGTLFSVGVLYYMDRNNSVGAGKTGALYLSSIFTSGNTSENVLRQASHLDTFIYLNAGDTLRFRAFSSSNATAANTSSDGSTFLNIVRIK